MGVGLVCFPNDKVLMPIQTNNPNKCITQRRSRASAETEHEREKLCVEELSSATVNQLMKYRVSPFDPPMDRWAVH